MGNRFPRVVFAIMVIILLPYLCPAAQASTEEEWSSISNESGFYDRIMNILKVPPRLEQPSSAAVNEKKEMLEKRDTPIFGDPEVTKEQMIKFIHRYNSFPKLGCSVEELVTLYYEEAGLEGVRPDLALVQAIHETGFFRFGGDVLPEQNNFAGIGTTGNGVRGIWFSSPRMGIRAHIQHLLAYTTTRQPVEPIVDPRYYIVRDMPTHFAQCSTWESLSGKWAVPGVNYGRRIVKMLENIREAQ